MKLSKRSVWIGVLVIIGALVLWWAYFTYWVPRFHMDSKGDLVSGNTKLVLVSQMLPNDKVKITTPRMIPFWKSIGIVDGSTPGRLWNFTYDGNRYVLYEPNVEMPWKTVYKYATK
ncbi:hypothetical protein [Alicyclobacillus dauci]|uniref:DUF3139 domain-containing protein n=1 Tax=Alicyclobacillus dauci TaxID=1475485 RepID=A0ABY6Z3M0_9BACL|nr:hypothetical protein [Alicyclobacillus dauci]WAH37441.1 hypothetical protein NZD86_02560 [Alicyclobacillus dauci]